MKKQLKSVLSIGLGLTLTIAGAQNLSEGFEGSVFPPEDWTVINGGDNNTWFQHTSSSTAHSGSASARINYSSTAHDDWLITPKLTISSATDSIHFWSKNHSSSFLDEFRVKVSTETNQQTDFTYILDTLATPGTSWEKFSYDLSAFNGQDIYVAVEAISTNEFYLYVDDFSGPALFVPSCAKTDSIELINVTATSGEFTWPVVSNAQDYLVRVYEEGSTPMNGTPVFSGTTSTNTISATGLTSNTAYTVFVNTICSATDTSDARYKDFTTLCDFYPALNETFENLNGEDLPGCWSVINNATTVYATVKAVTYGSPANGSYHARLFCSSDVNAEQYLITPPLTDLDNGTHRIRFTSKNGGSGEKLVIGTMSDASDVNSFTFIDTVEITSSEEEYIYDFTQVISDNYIAFHHVPNSTSDRIYLDNIVWEEIPSCLSSTMFNSSNVTSNSVDLNWNNPSMASDFAIEYGESGFTLGTGTVLSITDTFTTVSTLLPATSYDFYVKTVCSASDSSVYSNVISIQTLCVPVNEVIESFESISGTELPICWSKIVNSTSTYAYVQSTSTGTPADGSRQISFYNSTSTSSDLILVAPELNTLSNKRLKFYSRGNSGDYIKVGSMTDPTDASTFTVIDSFSLTTSQQEFEVILNGTYVGNSLAFKADFADTYDYMYVDHVRLTELPSCIEPSHLIASVISETEINLSWTANNGETQWLVEYGNTGFTPGNGQVELATTNPFTIDGLTFGDTLDVYVRGLCSSTDTSAYSVVLEEFILECAPESNTYQEDFTSFLPECWSIAKGMLTTNTQLTSDAGTSTMSWKADGYLNNGSTGAAKMNIYGGTANHWLISNSIELMPNHTRVLKFDAGLTDFGNSNAPDNGNFGNDDRFVVVISTDNGLTWSSDNILLTLDTSNAPSHLGQSYTLDLSAYSGFVKIGFYGESTVGNEDNDFFIDNFEIADAPTVLMNDIAGVSVVTNAEYCANEFIIPTVTVENTGEVQITEFDVEITLAGAQSLTFNENFTTTVDVGSQETVTLATIPALPAGSYTTTVVVTIADDSISTNNTVNTTFTVIAPETLTINNDVVICAGESIVLNASGSAQMEWSNGLTNGSSVTPTSTTTYTCTATSPEGCVVTESFTVTVEELNDPVIEFNSGVLSTVDSYATYQWSFNGTVVGQTEEITPTDNGLYTVVVTSNNGCTAEGEFVVQGLSTNAYQIEIASVYPNPTTGIVNLTGVKSEVEVNILNSYGQLVDKLTSTNGQINLAHLPKGLYVLKYTQNKQQHIAKVNKR